MVHFQNINIPDHVAASYATIFHTNWITTANLADTITNDLWQLGIEISGHIKAILHHARPTQPVSNPEPLTINPTATFIKTPAAKPPLILSDMTWPQFHKFRTDWNVFKCFTNLPDNQIHPQIYNACDKTVQNNLVHTVSDFFSLSKNELLDTLEAIVTNKSNPTADQLTFASLS